MTLRSLSGTDVKYMNNSSILVAYVTGARRGKGRGIRAKRGEGGGGSSYLHPLRAALALKCAPDFPYSPSSACHTLPY